LLLEGVAVTVGAGEVVVVGVGEVVVVGVGEVVVVGDDVGEVVAVVGDVVVVVVEVEVVVAGAVVVLTGLDDVDVDVSAIVDEVFEVWRFFDTSLFQRSYNQGFSAATESLNTPDSSASVSTALSVTDRESVRSAAESSPTLPLPPHPDRATKVAATAAIAKLRGRNEVGRWVVRGMQIMITPVRQRTPASGAQKAERSLSSRSGCSPRCDICHVSKSAFTDLRDRGEAIRDRRWP
jgi:hypothetical protein